MDKMINNRIKDNLLGKGIQIIDVVVAAAAQQELILLNLMSY